MSVHARLFWAGRFASFTAGSPSPSRAAPDAGERWNASTAATEHLGWNRLAVGSVANASTVATEHRVSDCGEAALANRLCTRAAGKKRLLQSSAGGNRLAVESVANASTVATEHRMLDCGEAALANRLCTRAAGKKMLARVVDRASASQESVSNRIARLCYILSIYSIYIQYIYRIY